MAVGGREKNWKGRRCEKEISMEAGEMGEVVAGRVRWIGKDEMEEEQQRGRLGLEAT